MTTNNVNLHVAISFYSDENSRNRHRFQPSHLKDVPRTYLRNVKQFEWTRIKSKLDRWSQLATVIRHLSLIPVARLKLEVYTNAPLTDMSGFGSILNRARGQSFHPIHVDISMLEHPYMLTWEHRHGVGRFLADAGNKDLFLYLEDDEVFTHANLVQFQSSREPLKEVGLIPSFLRIEFAQSLKKWVSTDLSHRVSLSQAPHLRDMESRRLFVGLPNPYCGMYMLDKELAGEFVDSEAFFEVRSRHLGLGTRERAANGLNGVNIPEGFGARGLVEFDPDDLHPTQGSLIQHLGDVYGNSRQIMFGTIPIDEILQH